LVVSDSGQSRAAGPAFLVSELQSYEEYLNRTEEDKTASLSFGFSLKLALVGGINIPDQCVVRRR